MALINDQTESLQRHMESFWKSICEIKLMPLTTDYFPDFSNRKINEKFVSEMINLDMKNSEKILENLSLRLTQYFQIVNPCATCDFPQSNNLNREYFRMSFRDRYAICQPMEKDQC